MLKTSTHTPLPTLPKQIRGQEATFGEEFRHWWNTAKMAGNFELKHTRGANSLPFAAVEPDQIVVGNAAQSRRGVLLRLTVGTPGAPDYVGQIKQPIYVVIRYPLAFYIITLEAFLAEKARSERKSLTSERAAAICTVWVSV